jgi:nucleoid-associated protein YgaU
VDTVAGSDPETPEADSEESDVELSEADSSELVDVPASVVDPADESEPVEDPEAFEEPESVEEPEAVELEDVPVEETAACRVSRPNAGSCPLTSTPNMSNHTAKKVQTVPAAIVRRIRLVIARWALTRAEPSSRALISRSESAEGCGRRVVGSVLIGVSIDSG